jgi:threonine dehydratase
VPGTFPQQPCAEQHLIEGDHLVLRVTGIWRARARLKDLILRTPLVFSPALSERTGCQIYLKMECWQLCGSFKVRGATNLVASLTGTERKRGLVTATSGNHGIALAYAARAFGQAPPTVFMVEGTDIARVDKMKALGARTVFLGKVFSEAYEQASQYASDKGSLLVQSYAPSEIMEGQGTIGLEIMEDLPDAEAILVPIGGGGLISGIATAAKSVSESVKIVGVVPTASPAAYLSLRDGTWYEEVETGASLADGLLGGFDHIPFEICRNLVDDVKLVEDAEIIQSMRACQQDEQLMVEAASAVGLGAILNGESVFRGQKIVLVLTGRNINAAKYNDVIRQAERRQDHG